MNKIKHSLIKSNGIQMHIAEQGTGPLVLLCHGFPESWYSWRHQLKALAEAGYRVVAPDMRGYGQTDQPQAIDQYSLFHLVGDMVGILDALEEPTAIIAGHDWGGPVAWHSALLRPDRFRAVIGLSVPFRSRGPVKPTSMMPQTDEKIFYQLYFQNEGIAESEFGRDPLTTLRRLLFGASADVPLGAGGAWEGASNTGMVNRSLGMLEDIQEPVKLPQWLGKEDLEFYANEFKRTGFRGGLNWYRNIDRNWEFLAPYAGAKVTVPALYISGDKDIVPKFPGSQQVIANMPIAVPKLTKHLILKDCGHWTQQERATEVNAAMIDFIKNLNH